MFKSTLVALRNKNAALSKEVDHIKRHIKRQLSIHQQPAAPRSKEMSPEASSTLQQIFATRNMFRKAAMEDYCALHAIDKSKWS